MMAYCSREAHSCMQKAAMIAFVKLRVLEPDENQSMRGHTLRQVTKRVVYGDKSLITRYF